MGIGFSFPYIHLRIADEYDLHCDEAINLSKKRKGNNFSNLKCLAIFKECIL